MTTGTLKDKVYTSVLVDIINGEYDVNTIISEKLLAKKLSVSRAPVREALVSLCEAGILRSMPRQGYMVTRFTDANLRDILEYRTLLECGCLEKSFDHITATQLKRLESILEGEFLFLSDGDLRDYWGRTLNFHLTLASFADNEYVYSRLCDALNTFMRAYLQLFWGRWKDSSMPEPSSLHVQIVEAIRTKDKRRALALLRRDVNTLQPPPAE